MRRGARLLLVALVLAVVSAGAAGAVGTRDVALEVDLPRAADGRPRLVLGTEEEPVRLVVHNASRETREIRVYAAGAFGSEAEGFGVDDEGTAQWVRGAQSITLAPGQRQDVELIADPRQLPEDVTHVGFVLEVGAGSTLVTRAAIVAHVRATGVLGSPIAPFILAALLLLALVLAHLARRRLERRRTAAPAMAPKAERQVLVAG